MASSRKSKPRKRSASGLAAVVAARVHTVAKRAQRVVVGLSGGVDSVVLLDALARAQKRLRFELHALHVNHQLSPNAGDWARFCRRICRERGVPCRVVKVNIKRGNSTERAAREARHAVFCASRAQLVALAHNADDQAETVLLQLLRGAGVKGLAAMPFVRTIMPRSQRRGAAAALNGTKIIRPLLDVPRSEIEQYARARKLQWIEDESNVDSNYQRNWLRSEVMPLVATRVPAYRDTIGRAAAHCGEAAELLDELAAIDAASEAERSDISLARLRRLSFARAKNVVRSLIASRGWPLPEADRLEEALRQALTARRDARVLVEFGEYALRRHSDQLYVIPAAHARKQADVLTWHGEQALELPDGILVMRRSRGRGLSAARMSAQRVTIRRRQGGERFKPDAKRPRRTLKNLLQEARLPIWEREHVPLIYCGETLACVPGIGIDEQFHARRGEASIVPVWRANAAVRRPP